MVISPGLNVFLVQMKLEPGVPCTDADSGMAVIHLFRQLSTN